MEKEQILSTLTEKVGKTSFSAQTLEAYVDLNPLAEGAEPDDAYWNKAVAFINKMQGQYNADMAAQVNDFKKNYKPETKPNPEDKGKGVGEKSDREKRLEQLENAQKESAKIASANALRSEVSAKGKSLKVANEAIWEDAVNAVQIGENDSADDVTAKAKKEYERMLKRYHGEGVSPYGSSGRQGASKEAEEEAKAKREAFKERMRRAGKLPKKENH